MAVFCPAVVIEPRDLKTCPYNPSHKIKPSRWDFHVIKCGRSAKEKLEPCLYDSSHYIKPELMAAHELECEAAEAYRRESESDAWREHLEWAAEQGRLDREREARIIADIKATGRAPRPCEPGYISPDWNYDYSYPKWIIPGLDGVRPPNITTAYGPGKFWYQTLTKSKRRAFNKELEANAARKRAEWEQAEAERKAKELQEAKEKEEQERLEKEKEEQDRKQKELEEKIKTRKQRIKAAKRAAFFAKQSGRDNPINGEDSNTGEIHK